MLIFDFDVNKFVFRINVMTKSFSILCKNFRVISIYSYIQLASIGIIGNSFIIIDSSVFFYYLSIFNLSKIVIHNYLATAVVEG